MNRIILIGNGFDLAHGLKTSYKNFIDWYWEDIGVKLSKEKTNIFEDQLCHFELNPNCGIGVWYLVKGHCLPNDINNYEFATTAKENPELSFFLFKSPLFNQICEKLKNNWVDIEAEFYNMLKNEENTDKAKQLNDDLDFIRKKLCEYLKTLDEPKKIENIQQLILQPFHYKDIAIESINTWGEMVENRLKWNENEWQDLCFKYANNSFDARMMMHNIKEIINSINKSNDHYELYINKINNGEYDDFLLPNDLLILNFNYTDTAEIYIPNTNSFYINHIHGSLQNLQGIIFGYGDELDENYKKILNKNDNEVLRNIKTFKYSNEQNYRNMLRFIESSPFQVFIMGHSCGNSDRTLLNTIFEHKNCVSIKPFYYKKADGSDNYTEVVQNIARNFTNMKLMRDRVVNKEYCNALPQNHRSTKE